MKTLYIIKCSDPLMWYSNMVGQTVPLLKELFDCYLSREPAGYTNIVKKQDAKVVDDEQDGQVRV